MLCPFGGAPVSRSNACSPGPKSREKRSQGQAASRCTRRAALTAMNFSRKAPQKALEALYPLNHGVFDRMLDHILVFLVVQHRNVHLASPAPKDCHFRSPFT